MTTFSQSLSSSLDFEELFKDEKGEGLCDTIDACAETNNRNKYGNHRGSDATLSQRFLQRRRELLNRRRRLRQMNPFCQCITRCFYCISDCVHCANAGISTDISMALFMQPTLEPSTAIDGSMDCRSTGCCRSFCELFGRRRSLFRKKKSMMGKSKPSLGTVPISLSPLGVGSALVPINKTPVDEEFEANAVGMHFRKYISYVAMTSAINAVAGWMPSCTVPQMPFTTITESSAIPSMTNGTENIPPVADTDPGLSLTEASVQLLKTGSAELHVAVVPEKFSIWPK